MKNILLIVVDTLRADHMSCYGYRHETSPFIDSWAKESVRFERCYTQAPWTIPSFTTIMSGMYPEGHRVVASPWNAPNALNIFYDDKLPILPELLLDSDFRTVAIDNLHQMGSHPRWFVRGYNHYVNSTRRSGLVHHHVRADEINADFTNWLDIHGEEPFFGFLHYWEPHLPYNQPEKYNSLFPNDPKDLELEDIGGGELYLPRCGKMSDLTPRALEAISLYDAEIKFLDDQIELLFEDLDRRGILDDTIVVFAGDHGEAMVEHGIWFNHENLFEPTVHVPLIVSHPDHRDDVKGVVVDDYVGLVDITPTLLEAAGISVPENVQGNSLLPYLKSGVSEQSRETIHSVQNGRKPCRMYMKDDWKLIKRYPSMTENGAQKEALELYNLKEDEFELQNLASDLKDRALSMEADMEQWVGGVTYPAGEGDPLRDSSKALDFYKYAGDPALAEFYSWVGQMPTP